MIRRSGTLAVVLYLILTVPVLAHNGEDHSQGGTDTSTIWLSAAGVLVVAALVYNLVRRHDPPAGIDRFDIDDRNDGLQ